MAKLGEDTEITLDIKTIVAVIFFLGTIIGMWFTLKADIELAKELPEPNISRTEYDLKDQMIRDAIMQTQTQVEGIAKDVKTIDARLFEIQQNQK